MKTLNELFKNAFLAAKNWKRFKYWQSKKEGHKFHDYERGAGYYLLIGVSCHNPIGQIWEAKMQSGKIGVYELVDYKCFSDPDDMVKESFWDFKGYKGHKPIASCSFKEYMAIYAIKKKQQ